MGMEEVGGKLNGDMLEMHDTMRVINDVDAFQRDGEKDGLMIADIEMNGNERDSDNKEICNKCGSMNYVAQNGGMVG